MEEPHQHQCDPSSVHNISVNGDIGVSPQPTGDLVVSSPPMSIQRIEPFYMRFPVERDKVEVGEEEEKDPIIVELALRFERLQLAHELLLETHLPDVMCTREQLRQQRLDVIEIEKTEIYAIDRISTLRNENRKVKSSEQTAKGVTDSAEVAKRTLELTETSMINKELKFYRDVVFRCSVLLIFIVWVLHKIRNLYFSQYNHHHQILSIPYLPSFLQPSQSFLIPCVLVCGSMGFIFILIASQGNTLVSFLLMFILVLLVMWNLHTDSILLYGFSMFRLATGVVLFCGLIAVVFLGLGKLLKKHELLRTMGVFGFGFWLLFGAACCGYYISWTDYPNLSQFEHSLLVHVREYVDTLLL